LASAPEISGQHPAHIRRYLTAVCIAAFASIPLTAAPYVSLLVSGRPNAVPVAVSLLIVVPYAVVLFRLWMSREKKGLALAVGWGTINFLLFFGALLIGLRVGRLPFRALLGSLIDVVLVAAALKGYLGLRREPKDGKRLVLGFVEAVAYFTLIGFIV